MFRKTSNMRKQFAKALVLAGLCLFSTTLSAQACEDGHWVENVTDDGKIVILEDGSVWLIDPVDRVDTALWLPTSDIVACSDKLINTDDGEIAAARRIR